MDDTGGPTAEQLRTVAERYTARFTAGGIEGLLALFHPDAAIEDPVGSPAHVGTEALRAFYEESRGLAPIIQLELTGPVRVAGREMAFPMRATTHLGDTRIEIDIIDTMVVGDDGRITQMRAYWSPEEMRTLDG